jgi:hypothetical protein
MRNRKGRQGEEPHMGLSCNGSGPLDQVPSFVATISIAELLFFTVAMLETHCVGKTTGTGHHRRINSDAALINFI